MSGLSVVTLCVMVDCYNRGGKCDQKRHAESALKGLLSALVDGARSALGVAAATAAAGIIVGVVTKTGLGLKMANGLLEYSWW